MWGTIANLKDNLNNIAFGVHYKEEDEMLRIYDDEITSNGEESRVSDRRNSNGSVRSKSGIRSPLTNGIDHVSVSEVTLTLSKLYWFVHIYHVVVCLSRI